MFCKCCSQCEKLTRSTCIFKPSEILVEEFLEQSFLIKGLLHGLRDVMLKQVKFCLFLDLLDFHSEKNVLPPGLRIEIKPPGFEYDKQAPIWGNWNRHAHESSWEFVKILNHHYIEEINKYQKMKNSLTKQCIDAIAMHKRINQESAMACVEKWISRNVQASMNAFTEIFNKQHCGICSGTQFRLLVFVSVLSLNHQNSGTSFSAKFFYCCRKSLVILERTLGLWEWPGKEYQN